MFQLATRLDLGSVPHLRPVRTPAPPRPRVPRLPRHPLAGWAERSQRAACRNAMAASTALAERRRERDEVAAYVETVLARRAGDVTPAPAPRTRALG